MNTNYTQALHTITKMLKMGARKCQYEINDIKYIYIHTHTEQYKHKYTYNIYTDENTRTHTHKLTYIYNKNIWKSKHKLCVNLSSTNTERMVWKLVLEFWNKTEINERMNGILKYKFINAGIEKYLNIFFI